MRKFGRLNYEKTAFWGRLLYSVSITNTLCEKFDAHRKIYDTVHIKFVADASCVESRLALQQLEIDSL